MHKKMKSVVFAAVFFVAAMGLSPAVELQAEETIILNDETGIVDVNLYNEILRVADENEDGKLQLSEAEALDMVFLHETDLKSLKGIEYCTNATYVSLENNQISDLSPLSNLTKIETLVLNGNKISNIDALKNLTNLVYLDLGVNEITDISALAGLANLETIWLQENQVCDISPLAGLYNLTAFRANENKISDISVLADKVKLEALELRANEGLTDISALANLKSLTQLNLDYNKIEDFSYLKDKTKMTDLTLWETGITSLDFMSEMTELEDLQLGRDDIGGNISVLSRMTKLKWINLCSLGITDLQPLKDLKELEWVGLTNNFIDDISVMSGWTKLENLDLSRNLITDISVLSNTKNMFNLDLDENYITDFSVLDQLTNLEYISIENNTPAPENGWLDMKGGMFWFENNVKQGTYNDPQGVLGDGTVRGREIYDPESDGWYWLDAVYMGLKATSKEVWMPYIYQNEAEWSEDEIRMNAEASGDMAEQVIREINNRTGKWVRYDENGKMYKGWYTVEGFDEMIYPDQVGNTYYYDPRTGLMAKGEVEIGGVVYYFDPVTGVLQK